MPSKSAFALPKLRKPPQRGVWRWLSPAALLLLLPLALAGCIEGASFEPTAGDTVGDTVSDTAGVSDVAVSPPDVLLDSAGVDLSVGVDGVEDSGAPDIEPGDVSPGDVSPGDVSPGDVSPGDVGPTGAAVPALLPAFVRGTARGGGLVLRPLGFGAIVRGESSGGGLRLRPVGGSL